jgi:small subunit ribosomal protein S19
MSRSKWKGPFISTKLIKDPIIIKKKFQNNIKTVYRHSEIIPTFVGMNFSVYNGKKFSKVVVIEEMIGFKFGEFSPTRKKFGFKKKKKKKKS